MKKLHTVLGEICMDELGAVLCHEHVACFHPAMKAGFGEQWFCTDEVVEKAIQLLRQAREECGVTTVIDGTPLDLGRDVEIMQRAASGSGVNIIASTGMYPCEATFLQGKKPEKFAQFFIHECEYGIRDTGVKPGMLKCATGSRGMTELNQMLLETMAIVQKETGLPLFAHNEHHLRTPYDQLRIFEKHGVNLEQVIIGHCSDSYDVDYLEDLLKSGVYLGFDRIYPKAHKEQARTMYQLINRGWEDRLLVSHDYFAFIDFGDTDWETQRDRVSSRSFTTVHKMLFPCLQEMGVSEKQLHKLTNENPARFLFGEG